MTRSISLGCKTLYGFMGWKINEQMVCPFVVVIYHGTSVLLCGVFDFCCGTAVSYIYIYKHTWCVSCNWERHNAACVPSVTAVLISLSKLKFLAYLLNVTKCFLMRIISYAYVVYFTCMWLLQLVMDGRYRSCHAIGCTVQHRDGTGKLFSFPRNPVPYVHKIKE